MGVSFPRQTATADEPAPDGWIDAFDAAFGPLFDRQTRATTAGWFWTLERGPGPMVMAEHRVNRWVVRAALPARYLMGEPSATAASTLDKLLLQIRQAGSLHVIDR